MASVNKVILVGNCGRDAEVRFLPSGQAVANVSLATTQRKKDKDGSLREETQWHRVVFYDRLAEVARDYATKGRSMYVEGRIKYSKFTGQDGVEKTAVEIVASTLLALGQRDVAAHATQSNEPIKPGAGSSEFDDLGDDIPF